MYLFIWRIDNVSERGLAVAQAATVEDARLLLSEEVDSWLIESEPDVVIQDGTFACAYIENNYGADE